MDGVMAFMMHMSVPLLLTRYALQESGCLHPSDGTKWDYVHRHFEDHLEEVNAVLVGAGRSPLVKVTGSAEIAANVNGHH